MKRIFILFLAVIMVMTTACSNPEEEEIAMLRGTAAENSEITIDLLCDLWVEMVNLKYDAESKIAENKTAVEYWKILDEDNADKGAAFLEALDNCMACFQSYRTSHPELALEEYDNFMFLYNEFITLGTEFVNNNEEDIHYYAAQTLSDEEKKERYPEGTVTFSNEAGYTVRFYVYYKHLDDIGFSYSHCTDRIRLGGTETFTIPVGAYDIKIICQAWNGSKWKDPFFSETYSTAPNYTFRTYGALPNCKMEVIKK